MLAGPTTELGTVAAIAFGGGRLVMSDLEKMLGLVDHRHVVSIIRALAANDPENLLAIVEELVAQSRDLGSALANLAEVLHRIALVQCVPNYRDPERSDWEAIEELAEALPAEDAQLFYQIAIKGRDELYLAPDPRTGLEMTLLRMLAFRPADSSASPAPAAPRTTAKARSTGGQSETRRAAEPQPAAARSESSPPAAAKQASKAAGNDWVTLQERLDVSGAVRELARNVQLKARSDDRWDFVIASALRHLGSASCVNRLSEAISDCMGHPVSVRLFDQDGGEPLTAAAIEQQQLHQTRSEAEKAIRDDPTVKALQEQMGAQLVEDSVQPLQ